MKKIVGHIMHYAAILVALVLANGFVVPSYAQHKWITTEGTEFWVTFMRNPQDGLVRDSVELSLMVSSKRSCTVTLSNPNTGWYSGPHSVFPGYTTQLFIPAGEAYLNALCDTAVNKGVFVLASDSVSLFSANFNPTSYDGANILPMHMVGSRYVVYNYPPVVNRYSNEDYFSTLAIVATENGTVVDITPSVDVVMDTIRRARTRFSVSIPRRGQVMYLRSRDIDTSGDISGTEIESRNCKKIAVFAGAELINIPSADTGSSDHIYEQLLSKDVFGTKFVVTNTLDNVNVNRVYDLVRITATKDTTIVKKNGVVIDTILDSLKTHEYRIRGGENSAFFETSKPSAMCQYLVSNEIQGNGYGDPSMVWITPVEQFVDNISFSTFSPSSQQINGAPRRHFINIVTKTSDRTNLLLDNTAITGWQTVAGNPAYSFVRKQIAHTSQSHLLNGARFSAFVYGYDIAVSYAYSVGYAFNRHYDMLVDNVSIMDSNVSHNFRAGCPIEFSANVSYGYDSVVWNFGDGRKEERGDTVRHSFLRGGSFEVAMRVYSSNFCDRAIDTLTFFPINIDTLGDTIPRTVCAGRTFDTLGRRFSSTGFHAIPKRLPDSCFYNLVIDLTVSDTLRNNIWESICASGSTTVNDSVYSHAGTYRQKLKTPDGCDSILSVIVTVTDTIRDTINQVVCAGANYVHDGTTYNRRGLYRKHLHTATGCDSILYINLGVNDTLRDTIRRSICAGTSFDTNGQRYTRTGFYSQLIRDATTLCYTRLYIDISVGDTLRGIVRETICAGGSTTINDSVYNRAGSYRQKLRTPGGCDSILSVVITVADTIRDTISHTICAGSSFTHDNQTYSRRGLYHQHLHTLAGCDSILYINISENDTFRTERHDTICAGKVFRYEGQSHTVSEVFTYRHQTATGCDSTVVVYLVVNDTLRDTISRTICKGDRFDTNGNSYTQTGVYHQTYRSPDSCLNKLRINVRVLDTMHIHIDSAMCAGSVLVYGDSSYYTPGVHNQVVRDTDHCEIVEVNITILDTLRDTVQRTVCAGASFDTNDQHYYLPGIHNYLTRDSISLCYHNLRIELSVTDTLRDTLYYNICAGQKVDANHQEYYSQGIYYQLLQDSTTRCFTKLVLDITVRDTIRDTIHPTVCAGGIFDTNGRDYFLPGVYTQLNQDSVTHCYEILVIDLTVLDTVRDTIYPVICAGETFDTNNRHYTQSGIYTQYLMDSATMCYHDLVVSLTVNDTFRDTVYPVLCKGMTYINGNDTLDSTGVYTLRYQTVHGCDSVIVVDLTVYDTIRETVRRVICAGATFDTLGERFYLDSIYEIVIFDGSPCGRHYLTIELTVIDTLRDTIWDTICAGAKLDTNGHLGCTPVSGVNYPPYTHTGVYTQYLRSSGNCFQNLVIYLTVRDTLRDTVWDTICAGASFDTNGRQYFLPGQYTQHLRQPDSCFNNLVINISVRDTLRDTVHPVICAGERYDTNGRSYTRQGMFTQYLRDPVSRCYNNLVIDLTVNDTFRDHIYDTVCAGAYTSHNGISYYLPGTHLQRYRTVLGCDSIVAIHLTVRDTLRDTVYREVCAGASFDTNGVRYYFQGVHTQRLRDSASGCFHNLVVDLTVRDTIRTHVYDTVCEGETYRFNSVYYTTTGVYRHMMRTREGCDSITYLHLQVNPVAMVRVYDTCYLPTYYYADTFYTQPGVYRHIFQRVGTGCDSMVTLYLKFCDSIVTVLYDTICNDSVYSFGNRILTESGVYYRKEFSVKGCDSIIELHLVVVNYPRVELVDSGGYCVNGYATLKLTTDGNRIQWTAFPADSSLAGQEHNTTVYVSPKRMTIYTVEVDSVPRVKTCVSTASVTLQKASAVRAKFNRDPMETTMGNLQTCFIDISIGNVVYREWLIHETSPMATDKRYEYDSIVWFTPLAESDSFRVRLAIRNDVGCADTAIGIYPILKGDLWVPNAFTPDENFNTVFKVGAYNLAEYEIYIYSRAGLLVFHSTDPAEGWDGTHNGHQCIPASYVYVINYKTNTHPKQPLKKVGSVLLIR